MRIAFGGVDHESCSFLPADTPLAEFLTPELYFDSAGLAKRSGDANTVIDGFLTTLRRHGVESVPLVWSHGPSGGQPTMATHEAMKKRLLEPLRKALPVDGVLLSTHGSYSVRGIDDADGDILKEVRQLIGPDCPIMTAHDIHCNIGQDMVDHATVLTVMETYPHTDMAERGAEAAELMVRTVRGEIQPTMAWRSLPLFWSAAHMISAEEPMRSAVDRLHQLEGEAGVLTASLGVGYQWADVHCAGASAMVVTDNDPAAAQDKADALARWVWERRDVWQRPSLSPEEALAQGEAIGKYPIILADQADNPGGGAPGDSTEILRLFIERGLRDAAVLYVVDPETVQQAKRAGVGNTVSVEVGGKSHPLCGPPVAVEATVAAVTDGRFVYDGPMWRNVEANLGDSVLLESRGVSIVLISTGVQPIDLAFSRTLGLDCRKLRYLCLKSTGHFRSGFEPIAGSIFNVDASGLLPQDFSKLPFKRLGRKIYPMDQDATLEI
jgi:microcystin degradation protein MlrC